MEKSDMGPLYKGHLTPKGVTTHRLGTTDLQGKLGCPHLVGRPVQLSALQGFLKPRRGNATTKILGGSF